MQVETVSLYNCFSIYFSWYSYRHSVCAFCVQVVDYGFGPVFATLAVEIVQKFGKLKELVLYQVQPLLEMFRAKFWELQSMRSARNLQRKLKHGRFFLMLRTPT